MAKTYDRISTFLGKPKTRNKHRNDQNIETQIKKEINKFAEKTEFKARVVGIPRIDEKSSFSSATSGNDLSIENAAYVRTMDIDEYFLPDPAKVKNKSSKVVIDIILAHPVAVIAPEAEGTTIKLGDLVLCTFDNNPGNKGLQRGMRIIKVLNDPESEKYGRDLIKNLGADGYGALPALFENGGFSSNAPSSKLIDNFEKDLKKAIEALGLPFRVTDRSRTVDQQMDRIRNKYYKNGPEEVKSTYGQTKGAKMNKAIEDGNDSELRKLAAGSSGHLGGAAIDIRSKKYTNEQISTVLEVIRKLGGNPLLENMKGCWTNPGRNVTTTERIKGAKPGGDGPKTPCHNEHIHIDIPSDYKSQ